MQMLEDRRLLRRLRSGDSRALRCIYENHKDRLLTIATCLLGDLAAAEDCLHDVFVDFVASAASTAGPDVRRSLKGYLTTCLANRCRDQLRRKSQQDVPLTKFPDPPDTRANPAAQLIDCEESTSLFSALAQLPYQQREAITMHLQADLTFRQIAHLQAVSINTTQSRYRYGIDKLRKLLTQAVEQ